MFRLLTLHINWLAELYHSCTTNLSDKVFSVVTTGHLRVGCWPTLALCHVFLVLDNKSLIITEIIINGTSQIKCEDVCTA